MQQMLPSPAWVLEGSPPRGPRCLAGLQVELLAAAGGPRGSKASPLAVSWQHPPLWRQRFGCLRRDAALRVLMVRSLSAGSKSVWWGWCASPLALATAASATPETAHPQLGWLVPTSLFLCSLASSCRLTRIRALEVITQKNPGFKKTQATHNST